MPPGSGTFEPEDEKKELQHNREEKSREEVRVLKDGGEKEE